MKGERQGEKEQGTNTQLEGKIQLFQRLKHSIDSFHYHHNSFKVANLTDKGRKC